MTKPNIIPQNGWIALCLYCGEQTGNSRKFCATCTTQKGRKAIFDANMVILKEKQAQGVPVPTSFRSWK